MSQKFEDSYPLSVQGGFTTGLPVVLTGTAATLNVAGAVTLTNGLTVNSITNTGVSVGGKANVITSALVGATVVLTAAQSGSVLINASTSGSPSWTLPAATTSGINFTFLTANTTTGYTITGAQVIHAKTSATGTAITSTTTITNTQGTAVVGDSLEIVSDGAVWWVREQSGIFAAS